MFDANVFPWYEKIGVPIEDLSYVERLMRLEKQGKLEDLQSVKEIQTREGYLSLPKYFQIMENWNYYKKEAQKYRERDINKEKWLSNRLSKNSFWAVRVARFVRQNNLSDDPERDLFCCLKDNDILLYIEFLFAEDIFGQIVEIKSPIKAPDLDFKNPRERLLRSNMEEEYPEIGDFRELYHDSVSARRLRETLTMLLSPGLSKKDKIIILNYLVNKESSGSNNSFLNTKYPKEYTQRVWKSLLGQKSLLLLSKEKILKSYNNYREVQPMNGGLGSIVKKITGSRIRLSSEKYNKYKRITKEEQERLNIWMKKLQR